MKVSLREELLAKELYTKDMNEHQGEYVPWDDQIDPVKRSYLRQAMRVVNSAWFKNQIKEARLLGAYQEAVAINEKNPDNRLS